MGSKQVVLHSCLLSAAGFRAATKKQVGKRPRRCVLAYTLIEQAEAGSTTMPAAVIEQTEAFVLELV